MIKKDIYIFQRNTSMIISCTIGLRDITIRSLRVFLDAVGIILKKNHLSHYKIVILDKVRGKIECVTTASSFSVGTLITYNIRAIGTTNFISNGTLLYTPLSLAQTDILFFHHILELIYYFTPIGSYTQDLFDLLAFLYSTEHTTITRLFKKIFLLKLLICMGNTPEITHSHDDIVTHLSTIDIKLLSEVAINTVDEEKLDRWLWCCVWQHPYVNEFKTVHFLAKNRAL